MRSWNKWVQLGLPQNDHEIDNLCPAGPEVKVFPVALIPVTRSPAGSPP